jgi:hypothetical protein
LKPGPFPYVANATLGQVVNFENGSDTRACLPLLLSGDAIAWLHRAYLSGSDLLVQRCMELDPKAEQTTGNRHGSVNSVWEKLIVDREGLSWRFVPFEATGWGPFTSPTFCGRFVAYWSSQDDALVPAIYDITARRQVASQSLGAVTLDTDNALPQPAWNDSCSQASFDARRAGKSTVQLKTTAK